ncbi:hypothetical protein GCM10010517_68250 [Streptosporangium fragile]|uniref:Uncharacterized protein n=1 Tax=Streptosporangium fragile TaxID=46186 RepID=A0ABP6IQ41_9ACTN
MALSGTANAATTAKAAASAQHAESAAVRYDDPHAWLDSASVVTSVTPLTVLTFHVTAHNGVPWLRDPRTSTWHNLRGVPGSQGGYVTNISISQVYPVPPIDGMAAPVAVRITARVNNDRLYSTVCNVTNALSGNPLPCTTWTLISPP